MKLSILALCGLFPVVATAGAQTRTRSDSIPRELATALIGGTFGTRTVDIHVGLADDSLPADMFRDALIIGFGDTRVSVTTVAYFPYTPLVTIDTIRARLVASGWKAPTPPVTSERGFVSSYGPANQSDALCKGSSVVFPSVSQRTINRTLGVIARQLSRGAADIYCGDRESMRARFGNPAADTPLPALTPPPGMSSRGGGTSGSPDGDRAMSMETHLEGDLPATDIATHYARLFANGGWSQADSVATGRLSVRTFEITDADGVPWYCDLIVSVAKRGAAQVSLHLIRR